MRINESLFGGESHTPEAVEALESRGGGGGERGGGQRDLRGIRPWGE